MREREREGGREGEGGIERGGGRWGSRRIFINLGFFESL